MGYVRPPYGDFFNENLLVLLLLHFFGQILTKIIIFEPILINVCRNFTKNHFKFEKNVLILCYTEFARHLKFDGLGDGGAK